MVSRIEINYKQPLRSRDRFVVKLGMHKQGRLRFVFDQSIIRAGGDGLALDAQVTGVLTRNGKPIAPALFDDVFQAHGWAL